MDLLFIGPFGVSELVILGFFFVLPAIAWIWTLIRIITSEFQNPNDKTLWAVVVAILNFLGVVLYFIFGEKNRIRKKK